MVPDRFSRRSDRPCGRKSNRDTSKGYSSPGIPGNSRPEGTSRGYVHPLVIEDIRSGPEGFLIWLRVSCGFLRIESALSPAARKLRTVQTAILVPLKHGFPPMIFGSLAMYFSFRIRPSSFRPPIFRLLDSTLHQGLSAFNMGGSAGVVCGGPFPTCSRISSRRL